MRHAGVVVTVAIALVAYGAARLFHAPLDVFPEFAPPQVSIQAEAPGFAPEQVEALVTKPIEDVINGAPGIAQVRSQSIQGLSVITAVLAPGVDLFQARQSLTERLVEVTPRLPRGLVTPVLSPLTSSSSTVLVIGFTSDRLSAMEQRTLVDWVVRPRLLATAGVAKVASFGGDVRQYQVQLDPFRLRAHRVGIQEVVAAAERATAMRGGGVLDGPNQRITIRAEAPTVSVEGLGEVVVREQDGAVLRLRDLATIAEAGAPRFGDGLVNGEPGIVTVVSAQLGANTKVVATDVEQALEAIRPALERDGLRMQPDVFRPASFIDLALRNITTSLALGAVLVAVVLLLFLGDMRSAAISLTAIPLSLLSATLLLEQLGFSINTLTLGGLAIALGEVVDDAIIDVENIARRLREHDPGAGLGRLEDTVVSASMEVRGSVVYATFVVALVFLPVLGLSGVQGALFRPLALAYIFATLASLVVALTVTPALARLLLVRRGGGAHESRVMASLKGWYARALDGLFGAPGLVVGATLVVGLAATLTFPYFGATFLPEFQEGHYLIHMSAVPGTSLEENLRLGKIVTEQLRTDPRVRSVAQRAGRAELSEDTWGTHYAEFEVDLVPLSGRDAETVQDDLRALLQEIPGVNFAIRGFLAERIEETLTGSTAQVVIKVFGEDLDSLDLAARRVAEALAAMRGASDVQYDPPPVAPAATVRLRPDRLALAGLAPDDVLMAVETATRGRTVAQAYDGSRATDVVVILEPAARRHPEQLAGLPLATSGDRFVNLGAVADVYRTTGRYAIMHQGSRRVHTVTANVRGRDQGGFNEELRREVLPAVTLPAAVHVEVGGSGEVQRVARRELLLKSLLAGVGILLLLWLAFGKADRLLLVLVNLPLALVGGVLAVFASGGVLSLGSLVGFVTLFGIATRNAVMLLSHYDHLVREEGAEWGLATALRGALERLGPILMTALVTAIGLLPLALGSGDPGREVEGPMAVVILGGLISSTLLSLIVLPVLALRWLSWDRGDELR